MHPSVPIQQTIRFAMALTAATAALVFLGPLSSFAQDVQVYASYTANDPGPGSVLGVAPTPFFQVHLWAAGGTLPSGPEEACTIGQGHELCGLFLQFEGAGFLFNEFIGDPAFDSSGAGTPFQSSHFPSDQFNTHNFDLGIPGTGNRHLGILSIDATNADGGATIEVHGQAIGANAELRPVPQTTIVVPEARVVSGLLAGLAWIGLLNRGAGGKRS